MGVMEKFRTSDGSTLLIANTAYGESPTASGTAAKVATLVDSSDFYLPTEPSARGVTIHIKFANTNTADNPTLNVNSTGALPIYRYGTTYAGKTAETSWQAGAVVALTYIGDGWVMDTDSGGTVTGVTIKATSPIAVDSTAAITTSGTRTLSHASSGVTTGTYGTIATTALTPGFGDTFTVPAFTVNTYGHVTSASHHTVKIPALGTSATTAAKGNHTHTTTIATSSGTNQITLAHGTKYALTAGGTSYVFTMPASGNTDKEVKQNEYTAGSGGMFPEEILLSTVTGTGTGEANKSTSFTYTPIEEKLTITNSSVGSFLDLYGNMIHAWQPAEIGDGVICIKSNGSIIAGEHLVPDYAYTGSNVVHNEGSYNTVSGNYSHAEGGRASNEGNLASGQSCHAEGLATTASGNASHAEGGWNLSSGSCSHTDGYGNTASAENSHAEGRLCIVTGKYSHAEGWYTSCIGKASHSEGYQTCAYGPNESDADAAHAEGYQSSASGRGAHAEGRYSRATSTGSHAEGNTTRATGTYSHAEGDRTTASGEMSHAEGRQCKAINSYAHGEGYQSVASGTYSHAEGYCTTAGASSAHSEGYETSAESKYSHAEGYKTSAFDEAAHASGAYTSANNLGSVVLGHFNGAMTTGGKINNTTGTAFLIGKGTSETAPSNAFSVQYNGVTKAASTITASTTADYAEMFEWYDENLNNEDRVGYFITFEDGNKIRIVNNENDYILGISSGDPFVLGNGDCDYWTKLELRDDFNRVIYEPAQKTIIDEETGESVPVYDEDGNPVYEGTRPKYNPDYDPTRPYISRLDRKEWQAVGMLGVLRVRQDGTLVKNGYCTIDYSTGKATFIDHYNKNDYIYRVIQIINEEVAEIVFK